MSFDFAIHRLSSIRPMADSGMAGAPDISFDAVRKRPGMFVGSTGDPGIFQLALEVIGNAIDLVLRGDATSIEVSCFEDGSVEVHDDGPGLDIADDDVRSYIEKARDTPTADGHEPHIHIAQVGLGLWVVNALSERLRIDSTHENGRHVHEWRNGGDHHEVIEEAPKDPSLPTSTSVRFWPDPSIFGSAKVNPVELLRRVDELDQLLPDLTTFTFTYKSESSGEDGLASLMNRRRHKSLDSYWRHSVSVKGPDDMPIEIDLLLGLYDQEVEPHLRRPEDSLIFCNYREVTDGGSVQEAIRSALGAPADSPLRGLTVGCNLRMLSVEFSGPTRRRVNNPIALDAVAQAVRGLLAANPDAQDAAERLVEE